MMAAPSRRVLVLVVAVLLSAGACSSSEPPRRLAARPAAPVPEEAAAAPTITTTTVAPLPTPASIPRDSYAPEKVVELGTMEIPAIGLSHRIYQGVTLNNIDHGPSHWTGTALPGQRGNTVFAGHRVTNTAPFRNIHRLKVGDEVAFTVNGARSVYRVTGNVVVEPGDIWIGDQSEAFTGTLYSCHPPGSLAQRYVVKMELQGPSGPLSGGQGPSGPLGGKQGPSPT
ncbi:MAG: class E sortase [Actinomycetota bacterium]|nr:class E sortase [Actinomycetota bacterium]